MQFNVVIDVVIGLVVLFWIVATSSSFVVEAISSFVNLRGKALELFVREMLQGSDAAAQARQALGRFWLWIPRAAPRERPQAVDPVAAQASALDIADHPLIRQLAKPQASMRKGDTPPSYIPSDLFVMALVDRLRQSFGAVVALCEVAAALRRHIAGVVPAEWASWMSTVSPVAAGGKLRAMLEAIDADPASTPSLDAALQALPPDGVPARVLRILRSNQDAPPPLRLQVGGLWPDIQAVLDARALGVADLQAIVSSGRMPAPLATALKPLLDTANHDMEAFRQALAAWFDNVMDRATGWFRRYTQWLLGLVALFIAIALNLDAIYIGQRLSADREARDAAARVGQTIIEQGEGARALPQTYLFRERFKDGVWSSALTAGPGLVAAAESLARQVQPMLLASGRTMEPMLAWQAAGLSIMRRCPKGVGDSPCTAEQLKQQWDEQVKLREALGVELCRPPGSAASPTKAETDAADKRCAGLKARLTAGSGDAGEVLKALWSSELVTWQPKLAKAAWELRASFGEDDKERTEKALAFRDAMRAALDDAAKVLAATDDLLARLPSVGSLAKAFDRWTEPELGPAEGFGRFVLSLIGWLVTALMASLGAPMWFDLLNKLINRRITGPRPETATGSDS